VADLILPRGEQKVLKAEDKNYDRGLLVKLLDNGGYDMAYWYDKPDKPYPVEVLVDGKSIKKDAKVVEMKFHPKDYYDKVEENTINEIKSLKQLLSKVKSGRMDKKISKKLDNLVTRGDGFVVITKSKKDGYNRFNANRVDDRGVEVVPHMRDFRPGKVRGMMRHKPEHLLGDINWKDVKDMYMENTMKEGISVSDERYFGKRGIIIMIDDNGKMVSAIFKDKKNADKFNRNKTSDIKKLLKLAKGKKYPQAIDEARGSCWVGYKQIGMKDKGGRKVPNCVKEEVELYYEENGKGYGYTFEFITDKSLQEAEYQGRKVKLNKIMQGDAKKFKVYVKNPKGNVVKVNFGQGGDAKGGTMRIRKSNPGARKSFRARHNCDNPGPKHKARYWACRTW
jgi:hypothetical protein